MTIPNNISGPINEFRKDGNNAQHRYRSFDYCYNYFHPKSGNKVAHKNNIEKSCAMLGFYLASWGMLRGSSFTLSKSIKHYEPLIIYISQRPSSLWDIDVDSYKENSGLIIKTYNEIKKRVVEKDAKGNYKRHLTLVTKIMLGVFGIIPAYDDLFCSTFKEIFNERCSFSVFNKSSSSSSSSSSLVCINDFYIANKETIDSFQKEIFTRSFGGEKTALHYTKAKIIDMYAFQKGLVKAKEEKEEKKKEKKMIIQSTI